MEIVDTTANAPASDQVAELLEPREFQTVADIEAANLAQSNAVRLLGEYVTPIEVPKPDSFVSGLHIGPLRRHPINFDDYTFPKQDAAALAKAQKAAQKAAQKLSGVPEPEKPSATCRFLAR